MPERQKAPKYLKNAWYMACWDRDLGDAPMGVTMVGETIALYRANTGEVFGLEDRCPHRMAPLSLGRCEGTQLRCMCHGLVFNFDGSCAEIPGQEHIPPTVRVRTYPVIEKYNAIWVWLGEADRADRAMLPEFEGYGSPKWAMEPGHMDYDAPAKLVHDNLLDLSHVGFVHGVATAAGKPDHPQGQFHRLDGSRQASHAPRR